MKVEFLKLVLKNNNKLFLILDYLNYFKIIMCLSQFSLRTVNHKAMVYFVQVLCTVPRKITYKQVLYYTIKIKKTKILEEGKKKILVSSLKVTLFQASFNLEKYFYHDFQPPILFERKLNLGVLLKDLSIFKALLEERKKEKLCNVQKEKQQF